MSEMTTTKMRWIVLAIAVVAALMASRASAQVLTCDQSGQEGATVQAGQPFSYNWCHPVSEGASGFRFWRNGVQTPATVVKVDEPVTASGLQRYGIVLTEPSVGAFQYRVNAVKGATEGPLSPAFMLTVAQAVHPCDGADPTTGTVVAGTRTLDWCYPDGADGGSPITGWAVYVDGARTTVAALAGTANAAGRRIYSAPLTVVAGTRVIRTAPVNAIGEGASSPAFTLTATVPITVPTAVPGVRGVR